MSTARKSSSKGTPAEEKIQVELLPIIDAVVSNIKEVNDYRVPEYETPEFSFKPGINDALRRALKKYWSKKTQAFYSQF